MTIRTPNWNRPSSAAMPISKTLRAKFSLPVTYGTVALRRTVQIDHQEMEDGHHGSHGATARFYYLVRVYASAARLGGRNPGCLALPLRLRRHALAGCTADRVWQQSDSRRLIRTNRLGKIAGSRRRARDAFEDHHLLYRKMADI